MKTISKTSLLFLLTILVSAVVVLAGLPRMGFAKVYADFNGDGFDDLAVGVHREDIGSISDAGAVNVIYGSSTGLSSTGNQFWHQNNFGIDPAEGEDFFGDALAAGDFNGNGFDDLAVGVPFEDVICFFASVTDAGEVNVVYGSSSGLSSTGNQLWNQCISGIADTPEVLDLFGEAVE